MNRCDRVSREWQRFCEVGSRLRSEIESEDIFPFHLVMKWAWGEHLSNLWLGIVQSTSLDDALPSHQNYKVSGAALRSAICTVQVYSHCTLVQLVSSTNWRVGSNTATGEDTTHLNHADRRDLFCGKKVRFMGKNYCQRQITSDCDPLPPTKPNRSDVNCHKLWEGADKVS